MVALNTAARLVVHDEQAGHACQSGTRRAWAAVARCVAAAQQDDCCKRHTMLADLRDHCDGGVR
eukprot:2767340-Prymnesium_polylepis.1